MNIPSTSFWEFSTNIYHKPGVERALLMLQQRFGVDVNMLLLCCWAARFRHLRLPAGGIGDLVGLVDVWQADVVRPLRRLRHKLRSRQAGVLSDSAEALGERILDLELDAERIEQSFLESELPRHGVAMRPEEIRRGMAENLASYLRHEAVESDFEVTEYLITLMTAVFDIGAEDAKGLWQQVAASSARSKEVAA